MLSKSEKGLRVETPYLDVKYQSKLNGLLLPIPYQSLSSAPLYPLLTGGSRVCSRLGFFHGGLTQGIVMVRMIVKEVIR